MRRPNGRLSVLKFRTVLEAGFRRRSTADRARQPVPTSARISRRHGARPRLVWRLRWTTGFPAADAQAPGHRRGTGLDRAQPSSDPVASVLSRIEVPADGPREDRATMIGDGASATIADTGYESETGKGTDFITLTRRPGLVRRLLPLPQRPAEDAESSIVRID